MFTFRISAGAFCDARVNKNFKNSNGPEISFTFVYPKLVKCGTLINLLFLVQKYQASVQNVMVQIGNSQWKNKI